MDQLSYTERKLLRLAVNNRKRLRIQASLGPERRGPGRPLVEIDLDQLVYVSCTRCEWDKGPFDDISEAVDLLCRHLKELHLEA